MSALTTLARMLGVAPRLAEDALHSESAARAVLSRRNLFAAGAALAAGSVLVGGPLPLRVFTGGCEWWVAPTYAIPLGHHTLAEWARQQGPGFLCTTEY